MVTLLMHRAQHVGAVTAFCGVFVQPSAQQNGSAVRTTATIAKSIAATSLRIVLFSIRARNA
jgi:hypothetical protein